VTGFASPGCPNNAAGTRRSPSACSPMRAGSRSVQAFEGNRAATTSPVRTFQTGTSSASRGRPPNSEKARGIADRVIYYQYRHDRARRTLRGIDEQVAKAEKAVAGKAPVWYAALQGVIGPTEFGIAVMIFAGYRKIEAGPRVVDVK
jgi:hypothetical protein